jgi:hypothetical protein
MPVSASLSQENAGADAESVELSPRNCPVAATLPETESAVQGLVVAIPTFPAEVIAKRVVVANASVAELIENLPREEWSVK